MTEHNRNIRNADDEMAVCVTVTALGTEGSDEIADRVAELVDAEFGEQVDE